MKGEKDRDAWWLERNAGRLKLAVTDAQVEAFVERVAIKIEAANMDQDHARRSAFREMFEE